MHEEKAPPPEAADRLRFEIDPDRGRFGIEVRNLGVKHGEGTFAVRAGEITFDPKDLSTLEAVLSIDAASLQTGNENRDETLRSEAYLDVERYPEIVFTSTGVVSVDVSEVCLAGNVELHGDVRHVEVNVTFLGITHQGGRRNALFDVHTTVRQQQVAGRSGGLADLIGLVAGGRLALHMEIVAVEAGPPGPPPAA